MNEVKIAVNKMISTYKTIQLMQIKNALTVEFVQNSLNTISALINQIDQSKVAFNVIADLSSYEAALNKMLSENTLDQFLEIDFKCGYELPASGYDCLYLDHDTNEVYLTLFDAK